ncbi:MAG: class I SAM-dependent RNA methyltransferase, partial [Kiritimatiellae bacterium]|nr:class I SAM-dependent RNA methyltransferase [Kiritimatiellia bacterium]
MSSIWTTRANIGLACARGLAPFALREAREGGWGVVAHDASSVTVTGTLIDAMRLNLTLRTVHRVLFPLFEAQAKNLDHLYRHASEVPWEDWLEPDGYFCVTGVVKNDTVRDSRMPILRIKDAIADRMRAKCGSRPDSGRERNGAAIFFIWHERSLRVFIDTSGEPLSRRGYRLIPGDAPMQEPLAAACAMATDWNEATPFISPMCGSGTPAIEAAMIALHRAPGLTRKHFAFMSLRGYAEHGEPAWLAMREEAARNETPLSKMPRIVATDISRDAVRIARANAKAARVEQFISFGICDFADTAVPPGPATIFMNPEY